MTKSRGKKCNINERGEIMEEKFLEFMKNNRLSKNSRDSYLSDIKIFKKYYYDSYGEELTTLVHADISMYITYMRKEGRSVSTINRVIAAIKQYNLFLIEEKLQDGLVILDKDYIKVQRSMIPKKIPTQQQVNKLQHSACRDEKNAKRDYCFMAIFIFGGLRESEIVDLRVIDVKLEDRFLNIIGKGNKFRQVVINSVMYDALSEYLKERLEIKTENPYLFVGQKNKKNTEPLRRNFCNRLLDKYKELCNIPDLHPHALRAYFCTNALHNAGYKIDQVANQAGHSSLNTTKQYLIEDQKDLITLADNL